MLLTKFVLTWKDGEAVNPNSIFIYNFNAFGYTPSSSSTTNDFHSIAGAVVDFSDEPQGRSSLLKIVGNVLIMTTMEQVAELMVLSEKSGLGVNNLRKLFAALYPGGPIKQHLLYQGLMASGEWTKRVVRTSTLITTLRQT